MFNTTIDLNVLLILLAVIVVAIGGIIISTGIKRIQASKNTVSNRLTDFVTSPDKPRSGTVFQRIIHREITGSFFSRTIKPFFENFTSFLGRFTPRSALDKLEHQLAVAGNPLGMHAREFYGVRVIFLFFGIGLGVLINYKDSPLTLVHLLYGFLAILFFMYLPNLWLSSKTRERKDEFRRNLPDALDMLSVCVSAGLGFDQSLKKICDYWPTQLGAEFKRAIQEMEMGVSRADALRNLSNRIEVEEISSFIAIIIQAENIGMSFSDVLHSQAQQMRVLRQYRAKEMANTMPAKLIIPLALFIFPALIAVILGPVIPTILNLFS